MNDARDASRELPFRPFSAWPMIAMFLALEAAVIIWLARDPSAASGITFGLVTVFNAVCVAGFFIVAPNTSRVLVLFGVYRGTVRREGFYWTNPFTLRHRVSLKAYNVASETIKVNDDVGNPIEIGAVVVWQVRDTAQAIFDVERYHDYVDIQIETAIRQLASRYPYDHGLKGLDDEGFTLRDNADEISHELQAAIQQRLERAGITVIESRISHLAYAPEIASAMLQRQQASAVIAARRQIVDGAVGMVEHALEMLSDKHILELDDERRATLVGNLLVVLCGHSSPTPVLNTGSLYN